MLRSKYAWGQSGIGSKLGVSQLCNPCILLYYLIKKLHNRPSGCNISSVSTSFLCRLRVVAASYLPVICCCFIMVKTLYKSYITGILAILLGPPPLFFFPFPRRAPLPLPFGGFQLEFESISQVINHMTCYKFECSHWLKLQHSDWRATLVKDFFFNK